MPHRGTHASNPYNHAQAMRVSHYSVGWGAEVCGISVANCGNECQLSALTGDMNSLQVQYECFDGRRELFALVENGATDTSPEMYPHVREIRLFRMGAAL
jgi:hypothetical protein